MGARLFADQSSDDDDEVYDDEDDEDFDDEDETRMRTRRRGTGLERRDFRSVVTLTFVGFRPYSGADSTSTGR